MRFLILLLLFGSVGCSTAPLAGFLDRFYPGGVRDRGAPNDSGIGVGPPRPLDPLVEAPGLSIPSNPAAPTPTTPPSREDVVPPPTIGRNMGDLGRLAAYRPSSAAAGHR